MLWCYKVWFFLKKGISPTNILREYLALLFSCFPFTFERFPYHPNWFSSFLNKIGKTLQAYYCEYLFLKVGWITEWTLHYIFILILHQVIVWASCQMSIFLKHAHNIIICTWKCMCHACLLYSRLKDCFVWYYFFLIITLWGENNKSVCSILIIIYIEHVISLDCTAFFSKIRDYDSHNSFLVAVNSYFYSILMVLELYFLYVWKLSCNYNLI